MVVVWVGFENYRKKVMIQSLSSMVKMKMRKIDVISFSACQIERD